MKNINILDYYYYVALKTILPPFVFFFFFPFVSFYQRGSQKRTMRKNVYKQSSFVKISFCPTTNTRVYRRNKRLLIDELCINREISRDSRQLRILICMYILTWYTACNFWTVERDRLSKSFSIRVNNKFYDSQYRLAITSSSRYLSSYIFNLFSFLFSFLSPVKRHPNYLRRSVKQRIS